MKIAVYTCITGGYDSVKNISTQNNTDIDFICFTDNPNNDFKPSNWTFRNIPQDLIQLSKVKQQRLIKILPHKYLPEYDISLWIDGNIEIIGDVYEFIKQYDLNKYSLFTRKHPGRKCIYEEAKAVLNLKKDTKETVECQLCKYREQGFPPNFGLEETNVILRNHKDVNCKMLCNMWAKEIVSGSHRDQLSFDYCRWKNDFKIGYLNAPNLMKNKYFRLERHG